MNAAAPIYVVDSDVLMGKLDVREAAGTLPQSLELATPEIARVGGDVTLEFS
ncbi:MAG: hypothetical protein ABIU29_08825 [Chthoniobacterales bacterium]